MLTAIAGKSEAIDSEISENSSDDTGRENAQSRRTSARIKDQQTDFHNYIQDSEEDFDSDKEIKKMRIEMKEKLNGTRFLVIFFF